MMSAAVCQLSEQQVRKETFKIKHCFRCLLAVKKTLELRDMYQCQSKL